MTFQLDTTGYVDPIPPRGERYAPLPFYWDDLDAFTQGYVEAMFSGAVVELRRDAEDRVQMNLEDLGFRHLAPEALARIIADCASFENIAGGLGQKTGAVEGGRFWTGRQGGLSGAFGAAFPPLTVQLGDDGKVRFGA